MIDTKDWREFRIGDLFDALYKAKAHTKDEFDVAEIGDIRPLLPYVTRTDENNAVDLVVVNTGNIDGIEFGNALVIGDTTATISYQAESFVCGDHIVILRADWLNMFTGLFIKTILQNEQFRYSYGRAFTMDLISDTVIKLPAVVQATVDGHKYTPDWAYMEQFMRQLSHKPITTQIQSQHIPLETEKWGEFRIGDLFELENCKCGNAGDLDDGDDIWYIGAKKSDNGLMRKVAMPSDVSLLTKGNCIVFICDGAGSVGYANYMPCDFIGSTTLTVGYCSDMTPLSALFVVTVIDMNRFKYDYGRKLRKYLASDTIRLPITSDGSPDWQWMENYMKSLPYSDGISNGEVVA